MNWGFQFPNIFGMLNTFNIRGKMCASSEKSFVLVKKSFICGMQKVCRVCFGYEKDLER